MNIVIPMAGHGSRFADAGFELPKPLIPVRGRPMYSWATDSLPLELATRLVFVCQAAHLEQFPLAADILDRYAAYDPVIVALDGVTDGQLCTVLEARGELLLDEALLIYNADTYCVTDLATTLRPSGAGSVTDLTRDPATAGQPPHVDGIIGVFEAEGDHWSFARLGDDGLVVETAEKVRISPWATTGLYHFSFTSAFLTAADEMILADDRTRGEFFVAPLYNRLIAAGARIAVDVAHDVWPIGTPDELAIFERDHPDQS